VAYHRVRQHLNESVARGYLVELSAFVRLA